MPKRFNKWNVDDPDFRLMVEQVKNEIANELGITVPPDGYWGKHSSKELGKIGSQLQKRMPLLLEWKRQNNK